MMRKFFTLMKTLIALFRGFLQKRSASIEQKLSVAYCNPNAACCTGTTTIYNQLHSMNDSAHAGSFLFEHDGNTKRDFIPMAVSYDWLSEMNEEEMPADELSFDTYQEKQEDHFTHLSIVRLADENKQTFQDSFFTRKPILNTTTTKNKNTYSDDAKQKIASLECKPVPVNTPAFTGSPLTSIYHQTTIVL